jgi:signal transduction histidine kinase
MDPAQPLDPHPSAPASVGTKPLWFRSLYWRIGFGFIALLAVLLVAQIIIFLWLTDRIVGPSSRSPAQLASAIATDLSRDLTENPGLDLQQHVRSRFGHIYQPFLVVLKDGRAGSNRVQTLPPDFKRVAAFIARRHGLTNEFTRGERGRGPEGGGFGLGGPPPREIFDRPPGERGPADLPPGPGLERGFGDRPGEPGGRGGLRAETAPITVNGAEIGSVMVPGNSPPVFIAVWEVGPKLAWFALGLLGLGAAVTALAIFRPAHNRLMALEQAASELGQGRTDVRAAETGGDEVSSLARTFNRMAADLEARAKALAASDRARRQLLADVSHELMTPLTAIRGYTETLSMRDLGLDATTQGRYLAIIGEETLKLEALIGDLLDLARLEGGGGNLVFKDVTIAELFGRVIDRHGPAVREQRITIATEIEPPDLAVSADSQRLEQALQNLAANAIRHTPQDGTVHLRGTLDADGVHISVRDSGSGIPTEHLPKIFDRFYKVDASRSVGAGSVGATGSGLGLSIVQAIVGRHGGRITAANAPEGGAVFEMVLRAASREERSAESDRPQHSDISRQKAS